MSAGEAFRAAAESGDAAAVRDLLAEDVVLHSPVTFHPFEGRDAVAHVLATVIEVFEDFHYTDHLRDDSTTVLVFGARVGEREIDGVDILREDAAGRIGDITVLVRPLSGLTALAEEMQRRLGAAPPPAA